MTKISDIYKTANTALFSFEFFPPKTKEGELKFFQTVKEISALNPAFVSVTYGAGGSTRDKTIELSAELNKKYNFPVMCHFTCVGSNSIQILEILKKIQSNGLENIIALRGDPPADEGIFRKVPGGFANASELIAFIRENNFDFSIGAGCYPEKHPESSSMESEILNLKKKVDSGAEFLISQLFFSNSLFEKFCEKAHQAKITVPIVPGIMPITDFKQIERFKKMAGCFIPEDLILDLESVKDDTDKFLKTSIEFSIRQCRELLQYGVKGIHFYTLNQSKACFEIVKNLGI